MPLLLMLGCFPGACPTHGQVLSGTVRDSTGVPAAHVPVSLTCGTTPPVHTETAANGTFAFEGLPPCSFQLKVTQGDATAIAIVEMKTAPDKQVHDISLPSPTSRPRFAASGIRGLIDPGGYSASTSATAASGLLTKLASTNRVTAPDCASAASLRELKSKHDAAPEDTEFTLDYAGALIAAQRFEDASLLLNSLHDRDSDVRLLRLRASSSEGRGDFADAAHDYSAAYLTSGTTSDLFAEGREILLQGRTEDAATLYREGLKHSADDVSLLLGLGTTAFLSGRTSDAITLFLRAATSSLKDPRPYGFLASASTVSAGSADELQRVLKRHLELMPQDAEAHLALAVTLLHNAGDPASAALAEVEFQNAIRLNDTLAEAHFELGALMAHRGSHEEAARELKIAVALDPERRESRYRLAQELRKNGQPEAAAREMQAFQQIHENEATAGGDITRYLSVIGRPAVCDSHASTLQRK